MVEIIPRFRVGSDRDVPEAKKRGYAICSCCKEGPNGHRSILKYHTVGAPKDNNYYFVERGNHLALNLVDLSDPTFIPEPVINEALQFIKKHLTAGDSVLVHCNQGHSRGPTTALMYLRSAGEMPSGFVQSERIYHTLYPDYDPMQGMRQYARSHWASLAPQDYA